MQNMPRKRTGVPIQRPASSLSVDKSVCYFTLALVRWLTNSRYLTSVERRLRKLETLFAQMLPDVDIENALESTPLSNNVSSVETPFFDKVLDLPTSPPNGNNRAEELSEALPDEADGFDWKEQASDIDDIADGMAALSVEPEGVGYLGMSNTIPSVLMTLTGRRIDFRCGVPSVYSSLDEWVTETPDFPQRWSPLVGRV